jgi:antitoxin component YwqK of YwqJK toxin-antitoxin module
MIDEWKYNITIWDGESMEGRVEETYLNGKLNGNYKKYEGDVVIEEGQYANGLMTGEWIFRHSNGNLKAKGKYIKGDGGDKGASGAPINGREGDWKFYSENGDLKSTDSYRNGDMYYRIFYWEVDGKTPYKTESYLNGSLWSIDYWDTKGQKMKKDAIETNDSEAKDYSSKKVMAKGHCNKDPYYKNGHVHDTDISLKCGNCDSRIYGKCCNVGDPRDKNQEKEFTCNSCGAINIVKFSILRTLRRGDNF